MYVFQCGSAFFLVANILAVHSRRRCDVRILYIFHQAFNLAAVSADLRTAKDSQYDLLDIACPHLDKSAILSHRHLSRNILVYAHSQGMESFHYRRALHRHIGDQCSC